MTILYIISSLFVFLTFLPLLRHEAWWVRGWDFPRLQLVIIGLVVLAAQLFFFDLSFYVNLTLTGMVLTGIVYQSWWIFPYTGIYPKEVIAAPHHRKEDTIRIIAANVLTTNRKVNALLELVRRYEPDVLVTVETDKWWQKHLDVLEKEYVYAQKCPLNNFYGMHVYSKLQLKDTETTFLVEEDKPSMHATVVLPSGKTIRIHFLHPSPPSPTENDKSSERDAELVIVGKRVSEEKGAVIVTGDLNDVAWSATTRLFRKISGLLDPRVGRGMYNTFHAGYWFLRWPLDHIFHSKHLTFSMLKVLPDIGSDHFPILIELVYHEVDEQQGIQADAEDHEWAEKKAAAENVKTEDVPQ